MAISFVASAVGSSSPNTGTTVTLPGGMATDDLILVVAGVGDTADNGLAAPTEGGYTAVLGAGDLYANDVNAANLFFGNRLFGCQKPEVAPLPIGKIHPS